MVEKKAKREDFVRLRQRGRILSETGWQKLEEALQQWEVRTDQRRTFEKMAAEAGLDPGTVAKIFKRREGADLSKIEQLLRAFQLNVEAIDHCPLPQGIAQSADPNFVGRAGAIADLDALVERGAKVIVIQARGGVGKTTLARKYLQQEFGSFLEFPIAKETKDIASIESLIEEKLKQLGEEPGREFLVSIDRLKRKLQGEAIGILIDNLEPALDSSGKFIEPHRRYVELLRVLSDPSVQSVTLITSRERLYEPSVSVQHYLLNSLDVAAWEQFFQLRQLSPDVPSLAALHRAYGGNAKAMEIISSAIQTDHAGDVAAYWQANQDDLLIERALEDLVTQQFDRLQQLDQDAYNLLCRMGCYRYQDVPTVPIEGLVCLLWDVAENRHRRVIKTLQDLSLVEFENGEYWLHPVIRSEAIGRLREREDWKSTNCAAAEFWTGSTKLIKTIEAALKAFEAYHYYVEIYDFASATDVLIQRRSIDKKRTEDLGESFCRLGLLEPMLSAINNVVSSSKFGYSMYRLHHLLGDLYYAKGAIHQAVESYMMAQNIATEIPEERSYKLWHRVGQISCLFNLALCKIELWEIEEAKQLVEEAKSEVEKDTNWHSFNIEQAEWFCSLAIACCSSCLSFLSSLTEEKEVMTLLNYKSPQQILELNLNTWAYGYCLVKLGLTYVNLGESEKAIETLTQVISYSEEINYFQFKGQALVGLVELYRKNKSFEDSLFYGHESIRFNSILDAKCELAKSCYQLGLTYQAIGELEKSNSFFQKSIQLFSKMQAPKQVDRVRRSMEKEQ